MAEAKTTNKEVTLTLPQVKKRPLQQVIRTGKILWSPSPSSQQLKFKSPDSCVSRRTMKLFCYLFAVIMILTLGTTCFADPDESCNGKKVGDPCGGSYVCIPGGYCDVLPLDHPLGK